MATASSIQASTVRRLNETFKNHREYFELLQNTNSLIRQHFQLNKTRYNTKFIELC